MADKKNASEVDDWLDDIEDEEVDSVDLDQLDLDSLLDNDDESADSPTDDIDLDQSNIDALFDSVDSTPESTGTPAEEDSADLDQAGIDDLFNSGSTEDETPAQQASNEDTDVDSAELDQAGIDDLFNSDSTEDETPAQQASNEDTDVDSAELDQAGIDDLFNSDSTEDETPAQQASTEDTDVDSAELDQAGIDDLFGSETTADNASEQEVKKAASDADTEPVKEETTMPEENQGEGDTPAGESFASELDDMEDFFSDLEDDDSSEEPFESEDLDFSDMLEDDSNGDTLGTAGSAAAKDIPENSDSTVGMASADVAEIVAAAQEEKQQKSSFVLPFLPDSLNHLLVTGITLGLLLLIAGSWFFMRSGSEKIIPPPIAQQQQAAQTEETAANSVPVALDGVYSMGEKMGELEVPLIAEDSDSDPLTFEVTSPPLYGKLSGNPPELTYLPNKTFKGEDHFEFKVNDGKEESGIASVVITGPNLLKLADNKQKKEKEKIDNRVLRPKKPVIMARDSSLRLISTDEAVIDWARMWRQANHTAFNNKIHVNVDLESLNGELKRMNSGQSRYIPDKFFKGREIIQYRFKRGGISSAPGRIEIQVALGTPPPEIRFTSLARNYFVGEKVLIDASPTRDEHRNSIKFKWEQLDGPPVRITPVNKEKSIISFVMPSTFSSQSGPCIRLTAIDDMGQKVSRDLEMTPVSRRQTALWRGTRDGVAPDPEMDKKMLPWPY